jgi:hypothetical protein
MCPGPIPVAASPSQGRQIQVASSDLESRLDGRERVEGSAQVILGSGIVAGGLSQATQDPSGEADSVQALTLGRQLQALEGHVPRLLRVAGQA